MIFSVASSLLISSSLFWGSMMVHSVEGHAALSYPQGRQWFAHHHGQAKWQVNEGEDFFPKPEYNHYGFQAGGYEYGACGMLQPNRPDKDYTYNYETVYGNPVPWYTQAVYTEGEVIEINVTTTANHRGHFEFGVCTEWESPTQECFDEHPLEFVEDVYNGAPKDPIYPFRGYMASDAVPVNDSSGKQVISHRYKLPDNVSGEKVLLQWHWVSILGCYPEGYADYDFPAEWNMGNWWLPVCEVDGQGRLPSSGNDPQQYWQCSEIQILPSGPTQSPTNSPTNSPIFPTSTPIASPTSAPVDIPTSSPTPSPTDSPISPPVPTTPSPISENSPDACCSQKFNECVSWCGTTEQECLDCPPHNRVFWLPNGPDTSGCSPRWNSCTGNFDSCCEGLECVGDQYYAQCLHPFEIILT